MRPPANLHAIVVFGRFERLRVFPTAEDAEDHRCAQIKRLKDFPEAAEVWEDAEVISYKRVPKFRKKK